MTLPPIGQIGAVIDRVATLRRLVSADANRAVPTIQSDITFDAFGDTYQAAMSAAQPAPQPAMASLSAPPLATDVASVVGAPNVSPVPVIGSWAPDDMIAAVRGTATVPGARQIGGYGQMPVPAELAGYGNGKVPSTRLTPIGQSGHRLFAPAAAAWDGLVAAAATDGVAIRITDSYRSYDQQVDLVNRKGLYSEGGLAARPGTSIHGWGLAVDADITDARTLDWIRTNGPRFGFVEAVPREPWHWEFRPQQVS